jgi:hypothetical protein
VRRDSARLDLLECPPEEDCVPRPQSGSACPCLSFLSHKRHGTITLFAALNYVDGKIFSRMEKRHSHVEWLRFLKRIEGETPPELELHLDCRQLCDAQTPEGAPMAEAAPTHDGPVYAR